MNLLTAILSSTKDIISGYVVPGGPAYYCTLGLYFLGLTDFKVLTTSGLTYDVIRRLGICVIPVGVGETVFAIDLSDGRSLKLINKSLINLDLVNRWLDRDLMISLTAGEFPLESLSDVISGRRAVIDVQGFIRRDISGFIVNDYGRFWRLCRLISKKSILRGEATEFPPECRGSNVLRCATEFKVSLIVTNASDEIYFSTYDGFGGVLRPPNGITGISIGSGDVFTAVFTYNYLILNHDFIESIAMASTAATLKLRASTPWYTLNEVEGIYRKVLKSFKRITY